MTTQAAPDPRAVFSRALAQAAEVIDQVRPDQLDAPTPCDEMNVRRLLGHLVMVVQRVACAGRDEDPMTWPGEATGVADDSWVAAWQDAVDEIEPVWADDALLERDTVLPWTTMLGADTLRTYTNEIAVHTWDLAVATGQQPEWDRQVLEVAFDQIRRELPASARDELWRQVQAALPEDFPWEDPFGEAVPVPDDAPLIHRLVAYNGRRPTPP